jgi:2-succinyl-5-enolpyruvyl-6-hydroxy-3-cyclohexene-1-carboxylate synthase
MNPSTSRARAVVAEVIAGGVRDVALAPGSRSAPLALAFAAAERAGLIRLHVRADERSAGYLALGIAKVSGHPAAVVTTSGTAAVNLHPAIVEASYAGVPLVAITADRPPALRATGANQTIDQVNLFGVAPRWFAEVDVDDDVAVRSIVARALAVAADRSFPGPVHLNVPMAAPLVPDPGDEEWMPTAADRPRVRAVRSAAGSAPTLDDILLDRADTQRGLIIVGDHGDPAVPDLVRDLSAATGWPIISEPTGGCSGVPGALAHGTLLAGDPAWRDRSVPEVVVTVGAVGLSRGVADLVARAGTHVAVDPRPLTHLADPTRSARIVVDQVPQAHPRRAGDWSDRWVAADACARDIAAGIDHAEGLSGPVVARAVAAAVGVDDLLVIGSSWPIRHVAAFGGPLRTRTIANRGTSGIDGVVSMAWGAALAHHRATGGSTVCLLGDLTALYDRNGLLAAPGEERPPLTYVVIDNDGGGIFSSLEQGDDRFARDFDRVFGTPHGADLAELLAAPGIEVTRVTNGDDVGRTLSTSTLGVRILIAACAPRSHERAVIAAAQERLSTALSRIDVD